MGAARLPHKSRSRDLGVIGARFQQVSRRVDGGQNRILTVASYVSSARKYKNENENGAAPNRDAKRWDPKYWKIKRLDAEPQVLLELRHEAFYE
jgi:hypothetical protein